MRFSVTALSKLYSFVSAASVYQPVKVRSPFVGSAGLRAGAVSILTNHWVGAEPLPPLS